MPGKVVLKSKRTISGDITKYKDGSCLVCLKNGSIKFDKHEIQKIILYSNKDAASDSFASSLKITPGRQPIVTASNTPYDNLIHKAAIKHNVDPSLVKAVMKAESNFNPYDRSSKGACGLMQLMPGTAKLLGVKRIYSPEENILAGTKYLRDMLYRYNGNVENALAAYNAGPGAVEKYKSIPPYRETKNYIKKVTKYYKSYKDEEDGFCVYTDKNGCTTISNVR